MLPPARLPQTAADLDDWSVYADWLQTQGDPRGEMIARDLALQEVPDRPEVAAFHALTTRHCKLGKTALVGWCLGHVRTLVMVGAGRMTHQPSGIGGGTLAYAHQLLQTPLCSRLEELAVAYAPHSERAHWRRVMARLPATCRRIHIALAGEWRREDCEDLIAMLPPTVDEVALSVTRGAHSEIPIATFISDRFAVLDLSNASGLRPQTQAAVEAALAGTHRSGSGSHGSTSRRRSAGIDAASAVRAQRAWSRSTVTGSACSSRGRCSSVSSATA